MGPIRELQETQALSGVTACTPRWPSLSFTFYFYFFFFFFSYFSTRGKGSFWQTVSVLCTAEYSNTAKSIGRRSDRSIGSACSPFGHPTLTLANPTGQLFKAFNQWQCAIPSTLQKPIFRLCKRAAHCALKVPSQQPTLQL